MALHPTDCTFKTKDKWPPKGIGALALINQQLQYVSSCGRFFYLIYQASYAFILKKKLLSFGEDQYGTVLMSVT